MMGRLIFIVATLTLLAAPVPGAETKTETKTTFGTTRTQVGSSAEVSAVQGGRIPGVRLYVSDSHDIQTVLLVLTPAQAKELAGYLSEAAKSMGE